MTDADKRIAQLERKLARVSAARDEAQRLLETRSLELYEALKVAEEARDRLEKMAHTDPLTGLANRRMLEITYDRFAAIHLRKDLPFGLILFDLDSFKPINDNLGHEVGDQVLVELAVRLRQQTRGTDCVARIGGDEFVILCTHLSRVEDLVPISDRIRQCVMKPFKTGQHHSLMSASVGVAVSHPGDSLGQMLRRADEAMYSSKRSGKNKVTFELEGAYDGATLGLEGHVS